MSRPSSGRLTALPPSSEPSLVRIGYITKPHGIGGEVTVAFEADDPGLLKGDVILESPGGETAVYAVTRARTHHGSLLLSLEGVSGRNQAELLRRHRILIPRAKLPVLGDDEIYLADLPGLRVIAEEEGREREIGVIARVDVPAGQELWTITAPSGREILFPAVDEFVLDIDLESGEARIAPPPGLLALYLNDNKG